MLISKAALQAVAMCAPEKEFAALHTVLIEPDGTVAVMNQAAVAAVSPVTESVQNAWPLTKKGARLNGGQWVGAFGEKIVLSASAVMDIVKAIPADKQFKGVLEHCWMELDGPGEAGVTVVITDGKQRREMKVRRVATKWADWRKDMREIFMATLFSPGTKGLVLNRKRFTAVFEALNKVCAYDGAFHPMWWNIGPGGEVYIRAEHELNGQRMLVGVTGSDGEPPAFSKWEQEVVTIRRKAAMKIMV